MALSRQKVLGRKDEGSFVALPRKLMRHPDYAELSGTAMKVLNCLMYQYKGDNNGNLEATLDTAKKHGIHSSASLAKALKELIARELIIRTRTGRFLNPGGQCALYALAWKPIDECRGKMLEVGPTTTPVRKLSFE